MYSRLGFYCFSPPAIVHTGESYVLVGPHGSTPLTPLPLSATPSSSPILSAGMCANSSPEGDSPLFSQLHKWGPAKVTLQSNFTLPARTECILPCKVPHSYGNQLGMVSSLGEVSPYYVACTVTIRLVIDISLSGL